MKPLYCLSQEKEVELSTISAKAKRIIFGYHNLYQIPKEGERLSVDVINFNDFEDYDFKKVSITQIQELCYAYFFGNPQPVVIALTKSGSLYIMGKPRNRTKQRFGFTTEKQIEIGNELDYLEISFDYAGQHFINAELVQKTTAITDAIHVCGSIYAIKTDEYEGAILVNSI